MQALWLALFLAASPALAAGTGDPCPFDSLREGDLEMRRFGGTTASARFEGIVPLYGDQPVDPPATGMHLLFMEGADGPWVFDLAVPAGAGWVTRSPGRWTYRARVSSGVRRVVIKQIEPPSAYEAPRAYAIEVDAVGLELPVLSEPALSQDFHKVMVILDGSTEPWTPETYHLRPCGSQIFWPSLLSSGSLEPSPVWAHRCSPSAGGRGAHCKSARRVRPCRVSDPGDQLRCDLQQTNAAQAAFHDEHGTYFSGDCGDLPGLTLSPHGSCHTEGDANEFAVDAEHPILLQCRAANGSSSECHYR